MKQEIKCEVVSIGSISAGKKEQEYVTVLLFGEEVRLHVTKAMQKKICNGNKIKLTIEII